VLHLEHSTAWRWTFDILESKLETPGKFWNSVREKDGEDQLNRPDQARNEEILHRVKEERNILHTINRRKTNWIGYISRRNALIKHTVYGNIGGGVEVTGRQGRRCEQLLVDLKNTRRFWKLKQVELDRTLWIGKWLWTCRKTKEWMKE
jgi:hypothetical protein